MPTIVLARHGELAWNPWRSVAGRDLLAWREEGASAPLDPASRPGGALHRLAESSTMLIASPGLLLTTEAVVVEKNEEKPAPAGPPGGGMGGMY